jgi:hypothetical protein
LCSKATYVLKYEYMHVIHDVSEVINDVYEQLIEADPHLTDAELSLSLPPLPPPSLPPSLSLSHAAP